VYFDSLRAITFGPADLHGDTATWLVGGQKVDDTRLEGGGAHASRFVMTPTIRTHTLHVGGAKPGVDIESYYGPARGGTLDTHRLDTPSGDCRGMGLFVQDTQPVDMSFSFYWTLTAGHTFGWPQPFGAPSTGH
jgi:hypothetical protein